jgi:hypothetical protein
LSDPLPLGATGRLHTRPGADEWRRLFALLDVALELEPAARSSWRASLGPDDAALSPWLDDLLRRHADRETSDFLRQPARRRRAGHGGDRRTDRRPLRRTVSIAARDR